jgi:hypothetical protein
MQKSLLALLVLATITLSTAVNAAYVEGELKTVTLWAGQTMDAGEVKFEISGVNLVVTITTDSPWTMTETHLYLNTTPPTTHAPGQFPYKHLGLADVTQDVYTIPIADLDVGCGGTLYFAVHAVVRKPIVQEIGLVRTVEFQSETAWGFDNCERFGEGWGRYCSIIIPCDEPEEVPVLPVLAIPAAMGAIMLVFKKR